MQLFEIASDKKGNNPSPESTDDVLFSAIVHYVVADKKVTDEEFDELAASLNVEPPVLRETAFKLMQELLRRVGKHSGVPDSNFDKKELQMGIEVEKEHTASENVAKMIAKDHLMELPDYYSRLKRMEQSK